MPGPVQLLARVACLLAACLLIGCASRPRVVRIDFRPAPAVMKPLLAADGSPPVRLLATVVGAVPRPGDGTVFEMHVRLRVDNLGTGGLRLHARRTTLLAADFLPFEAARMIGDPPAADGSRRPTELTEPGLVVSPGGAEVVDLFFPMPDGRRPGRVRLDGLSLRISLLLDGTPVLMGAVFERLGTTAYPYDDPAVRVQVGPYPIGDPRPYRQFP